MKIELKEQLRREGIGEYRVDGALTISSFSKQFLEITEFKRI